MAIEIINVGASANDGNGDPIRDAFIKCNDNFDELETTKIAGSGTDNYVPKFNGTDAIENSQIFDNGTNVGIGTSSPSAKLDVNGVIKSNNDIISSNGTISSVLAYSSTYGAVFGSTSSHNANIYTNSLPRLTITTIGNVGIGTISPTSKLNIYDNATVYLDLQSVTASSLIRLKGGGYSGILGETSGVNQWFITGGGAVKTLTFGTDNTERMRIASSGNVGIGTTSPGAKLEVAGVIKVNDGYGVGFALLDNSSITREAEGMSLNTNNTRRVLITSSGNVGIGLTNPSSSAILHLKSNSQGFLPPTMTTSERNSIGGPENGLVIYNTDSETIDVYTTAGWKSLLYI